MSFSVNSMFLLFSFFIIVTVIMIFIIVIIVVIIVSVMASVGEFIATVVDPEDGEGEETDG